MKRAERIVVCILVIVMLVTIIDDAGLSFGVSDNLTEEVSAASGKGMTNIEPENIDSDEIMILEIVPDKEMAEFGWLVGGSEPVEASSVSIYDAENKYSEFLSVEDVLQENEAGELMTIRTVKNRELFKRYALGLQYKDNKPESGEEIETFTFKGWYTEPECLNKFNFDLPVTEDIILYAKWKDNLDLTPDVTDTPAIPDVDEDAVYSTEEHSVIFEENKPSKAYGDVGKMPVNQIIKDGGKAAEPDSPELMGNILYKIENTKVSVVTVTSSEICTEKGRIWLDRADLLVISDRAGCGFTGINKTFLNNDIDFQTACAIMEKVSRSDKICPVILTESIYSNAINDSSRIKTATVKTSFSGTSYLLGTEYGSKNNMYKLFIMLRQMAPNSVFSAYLKNNSINQESGVYGLQKEYSNKYNGNNRRNISNNAEAWNKYTLLPDQLFSDNRYNESELKKYNIYLNVLSGDDIRFNSSICNDTDGITRGFSTQKNSSLGLLTVAESIYALMNSSAVEIRDDDQTVLEIQPCKDFIGGSFWFWFLHGKMDGLTGDVNVKQFSSSEFIGNIEDLNSAYSLVYIGINSNGLLNYHKNSSYPNMVYTHIGKSVNGNSNQRGILGGNSDTIDKYYFSGNDITLVKRNEILEFAASGKPVVFAEGFLKNGYGSPAVDTSKVDKASNFYELATTMLMNSDYACYDMKNLMDTDSLRDVLNTNHIYIKMLKAPTEYRDLSSSRYSSLGLTERDIYVNGDDATNKNLVYRFVLETDDTAGTYYEVRLYIDTNADGKFDSVEEKLDSLEIYDETSGRNVRPKMLVGGHTFKLTRAADEYLGIMPWKLEVVKVGDDRQRYMVSGMAAIKADKDDAGNTIKEELKVLQIIPVEVSGCVASVYLPTDEEIDAATSGVWNPTYTSFRGIIKGVNDGVNVSNSIADVTGKFWEYTRNLADFKVSFDRIPVVGKNGVKGLDTAIHENENYLDDYNMLILGFQDCYSDITDTATLNAIEDFIYEGKTILFTHDTTSFVNVSKGYFNRQGQNAIYWGYNINQYFRELLGLDRFGVTITKGNTNTYGLSEDEIELLKYKDKAYKVNTKQSENRFYTSSTWPAKNLIQGLSNATLAYSSDRTSKVTVTNRGQITEYPYYISDEFNIAQTHSQYYQLDLETDDVVVWYTLTGDTGTNYYKCANDVRNNYYIYNKGNITYSGVGHSGGLTTEEVKLFVNTMIAAYSSAASASKPVIINREKSSDNNNNDYLYVDFITNDAKRATGSDIYTDVYGSRFKRTYFKLRNNSIVSNKQMTLIIYPASINSTINESGGISVQVDGNESSPLSADIFDAETGEKMTKRSVSFKRTDNGQIVNYTGSVVESGYEYYVDIPVDDLGEKDNIAIEMQVVMKYGKRQDKTLIGNRGVIYMRRGLFSLD